MIRSFIYAISGIAATVKSERNMRIHLAAAVAVVVLGAWLGLDVPRSSGVCTDVAIRALRDARKVDLHKLVHEDMKANWGRKRMTASSRILWPGIVE